MKKSWGPESQEYWLPSLKTFLSYRLSMLSRVLDQKNAGKVPKKMNLSVTESRVLDHLSIDQPATVRGLAEEMCLDKAQVSRAVTKLVDSDYAKREADQEDRRSVIFSRTKKGDKIFTQRLNEIRLGQQELLSVLEPEELKVLDKTIKKMMFYAKDEDI